MIEKGLVIGIDGFLGTGKSTLAKKLTRKYKSILHIEMSQIYSIFGKWYMFLEQKGYSEKDILCFINKYLRIEYKIINGSIIFASIIPIPKIDASNTDVKGNLYRILTELSLDETICKYLKDVINNVKKDYTVILTGRELEKIYPNLDYHFCLKANETIRIARVSKRDNITLQEAKKRNVQEKKEQEFSPYVISVSSDRLNEREVLSLFENVLLSTRKRDKIIKVHFFGSSSTGKSTICKLCGERYKEPYTLEFVREYMIERKMDANDHLGYEEFCDVAKTQLKLEKRAEKLAKRFVFADSGALTYAVLFKYIDLPEMAELVEKQLKEAEVIFVCDNNFEFVADGVRENPEVYKDLQKNLIAFLKKKNIPFVMLGGSVEERFRTVQEILKKYETRKKKI